MSAAAQTHGTGRIERWTRENPCPICDGHPSLPHGQGVRDWGFLSSDGKYAHCVRGEYSGALTLHRSGGTYAHRLEGDCRCGLRHGAAAPIAAIRSAGKNANDSPKLWAVPDNHIEMVHRYELGGELQFENVRIWKQYRRGAKVLPRHFGQDGRWYFGQGKWKGRRDKPLYRQDEALNELRLGGKIFICEGERDADALWDAGCIAVSNPDGAGTFREAQAQRLIEAMRKGEPAAEIDIIADDDSTGIDHAKAVRRMLAVDSDLRRRIRILRPPEGFNDAAEFLIGGQS